MVLTTGVSFSGLSTIFCGDLLIICSASSRFFHRGFRCLFAVILNSLRRSGLNDLRF